MEGRSQLHVESAGGEQRKDGSYEGEMRRTGESGGWGRVRNGKRGEKQCL